MADSVSPSYPHRAASCLTPRRAPPMLAVKSSAKCSEARLREQTMSRIGKNPVPIPTGVNVALAGQILNISGKLGKQALNIPSEIEVKVDQGKVVLTPRDETKR